MSLQQSLSTLLSLGSKRDSQESLCAIGNIKCEERVEQRGGGFPDSWDCLIASLGFGNSAQIFKAQTEGRKSRRIWAEFGCNGVGKAI